MQYSHLKENLWVGGWVVAAFLAALLYSQWVAMPTVQEASARPWWDLWLERASWFAQVLLVIIAAGAALFAKNQVSLMNRSREEQNFAAVTERTAEHNWKIYHDCHLREAVETFAGLKVAAEEKDLYWATRLTHLSHLLLLQQVWSLAGRNQPGEELTDPFKGWQRFAGFVSAELHGADSRIKERDSSKPDAYLKACSDLWKALEKLEETDPLFVKWLQHLPKP